MHGLGGDSIKTWTHPESNAFWLRDFLPRKVPDARILTFGYDSWTAFDRQYWNFIDVASHLVRCLAVLRNEENVSTLS